MLMAYYLALDVGNTKTDCALEISNGFAEEKPLFVGSVVGAIPLLPVSRAHASCRASGSKPKIFATRSHRTALVLLDGHPTQISRLLTAGLSTRKARATETWAPIEVAYTLAG